MAPEAEAQWDVEYLDKCRQVFRRLGKTPIWLDEKKRGLTFVPSRGGRVVQQQAVDVLRQWLMLLEPFARAGREPDALPKLIEFGWTMGFEPHFLTGVEGAEPLGLANGEYPEAFDTEIAVRREECEARLKCHVVDVLERLMAGGFFFLADDVKVYVLAVANERAAPDTLWVSGTSVNEKLRLDVKLAANPRILRFLRFHAEKYNLPWITHSLEPYGPSEFQSLTLLDWFLLGVIKGAFVKFIWLVRWHHHCMRAYDLTREQLLRDLDRRVVARCRTRRAGGIAITSVRCSYVAEPS